MKKFNSDKIRIFFIFYMIVLYTIDLFSTYLAMKGGGFEMNPVIKYFIDMGNSGYLLASFFFLSLVFLYVLMTEVICYFLTKYYNTEVVYISAYTSVLAMFSVVQISNIVGNFFIYLL